jgi:hypothetical protein
MATPARIVVNAALDPDIHVWFVESSDIHGLNLEGDTFDDLVAKVPGAVADLIEANGGYGDDVSIEIVGRVHTQPLRLAAE